MMPRTVFSWTILLALLWALSAAPAVAQTPVNSYIALELDFYIYPYNVNDAGHVVGGQEAESGTHASLLRDGVLTDLGTLGGSNSFARAINNRDQIVGWSYLTDDAFYHAFLVDEAGAMHDLGTLGGDYSLASDINDAGQVVGSSYNAEGAQRAFLWQNGQMYDLAIPAGFLESHASSINAAGQVTGMAYDSGGQGWAFRWTPTVPNGTTGTMLLLHPTAGNMASDINGFGEAVGSVTGEDGYSSYPALWDADGAHTLPLLPGGEQGTASAINDSRLVLGYNYLLMDDFQYESRVFVWDSVNGTRDLNVLAGYSTPYLLDSAYAINASGQILVSASNSVGYLLTPSPLPSRPLYVRAASDGGTGVNLSWNASYGANAYTVKRAMAYGGPYTTVATVSGTSWTDTTVASGNTYYVVSAVNAYGESADSDAALFAPRPAAPTNLTATAGKTKGQRQVTLQWKQSVSPGVTHNRIYRSTTRGGGYSLRATVSAGTAYTDTSVASRVTYYYVVTAVNGSTGQASGYSNQASAMAR